MDKMRFVVEYKIENKIMKQTTELIGADALIGDVGLKSACVSSKSKDMAEVCALIG